MISMKRKYLRNVCLIPLIAIFILFCLYCEKTEAKTSIEMVGCFDSDRYTQKEIAKMPTKDLIGIMADRVYCVQKSADKGYKDFPRLYDEMEEYINTISKRGDWEVNVVLSPNGLEYDLIPKVPFIDFSVTHFSGIWLNYSYFYKNFRIPEPYKSYLKIKTDPRISEVEFEEDVFMKKSHTQKQIKQLQKLKKAYPNFKPDAIDFTISNKKKVYGYVFFDLIHQRKQFFI